jgi:DNA mismatch repair protein MutL
MPKIRPLPPAVISAIAAGEIVERPAVIVKELAENALDAGASQITIEVIEGGKERIIVKDNGHGMDTDDLLLSIERHTTSKIFSAEDLHQLHTFGFRGEALASIAAVSKMTIQSRAEGSEVGYQLVINHGQQKTEKPVGMAVGTTIMVEELFRELPARRKFLKQTATELRHITQVVTQLALSHPQLGIFFTHNNQVICTLPQNQTFGERIFSLFGSEITRSFIPIADQTQSAADSSLLITGALGVPQSGRRTRAHQYLFVNQRPITDQLISHTVKEAYGSLLAAKIEPAFILSITLPADKVDVNIHPRKEMVRFLEAPELKQHLHAIIKSTLQTADLSYTYKPESDVSLWVLNDSAGPANTHPIQSQDRSASPATHEILKNLVHLWSLDESPADHILQIDKTYLCAPTKSGFLLVDQHAAHERILFEQLKEALRSADQKLITSTQLSPPQVVELSLSDSQVLVQELETLTRLGFEIEHFGRNSFKISQVPTLLADHDLRQTLQDFIDNHLEGNPTTGVDQATERTLTYLACRSAVKAGDYLTPQQRQDLLTKLSQTPNQATCPHGRPTTIIYSQYELEKMFHRR